MVFSSLHCLANFKHFPLSQHFTVCCFCQIQCFERVSTLAIDWTLKFSIVFTYHCHSLFNWLCFQCSGLIYTIQLFLYHHNMDIYKAGGENGWMDLETLPSTTEWKQSSVTHIQPKIKHLDTNSSEYLCGSCDSPRGARVEPAWTCIAKKKKKL